MTDKERILRLLTIRPEDLRRWSKLCRDVLKQVAIAHPDYPVLRDAQLMSIVKRLLPEIRAMIRADEDIPRDEPV
jgi:hypothetical protein